MTEYASPLKLFEYMALGRAIVAPDQRNIREVLTEGKDALLFEPSDSEAFNDAIRRLVADADLRQSLGQGAVATIHERRLPWDANAERVETLFATLMDRGAKHG